VPVSSQEFVDLVFRTLNAEQAKQAAKAVDTEIDKIGPSSERTATRTISAFDRMSSSMSRISRVVSGFGALEIFNRAIGMARTFARVIEDLAERTPRTNEAMLRLKNSAGELATEFTRGLDSGGRFSNALGGMAENMTGTRDAARTLGAGLSGLVEILGDVNRAMNAIGSLGTSELFGYLGGLAMAGTENVERFLSPGNQVGGVANVFPAFTEQEIPSILGGHAGDRGRGEYRYGPPRGSRSGRTGGAAVASQEDLSWLDDITGYQTAINEGLEEEANLARQAAEATMAFREREAEWIRENKDAEISAIQERSDAMERIREQEEQRRNEEVERSRERMADMSSYANSFVSVGGTIAGVFGQLAAREEEGSEAAKRYGKVQGGIMAAMSFIQSAIEYAQGIASIAKYDYAAAAEHFAAGIAFDVAGAMAIAQLGGDAAGSSGGGNRRGTGTFVPEQSPTKGDSGEPGGAVVQIYTMGGTSARLGQEMQRAQREMQRSGIDTAMAGAGGYS